MATTAMDVVQPELPVFQAPIAESKPELSMSERPKKRHQVSKACQHCAASHLSCSEVRPCDRCVKKGLDCEERPRKRRNVRSQDLSRYESRHIDDDDEHVPMDDAFSPRSEPRPSRSRRNKKRSVDDSEEEYIPEDDHVHGPDCHHGTGLYLSVPHTVTPTSVSPRSAHLSDSSSDADHYHSNKKQRVATAAVKQDAFDLESLVVAALAEEQRPATPGLQMNQIKNNQAMLANQSNMMMMPGMYDPRMMMPQMTVMPQYVMPQMMYQQPNAQPQSQQYVNMEMPGFPMMGMMAIQWRFQGQPMPAVNLPLSATSRDLHTVINNRLLFDRIVQSPERLAYYVTVSQQKYSLDDPNVANMPLTYLGFADPSALLEVIKTN